MIYTHEQPRKTPKDIKLSKQVLEVVIKHSKTDQTGKDSKVIIGPGNHRLCPLKLLRKFLQYREQVPRSDALFRFYNTSLLTRAKLERTLQEAQCYRRYIRAPHNALFKLTSKLCHPYFTARLSDLKLGYGPLLLDAFSTQTTN